ncbi:MAG: hypothetical protein PHD32_00325 [Eubacteriales bacterium]|nr:hypothetical protein [Eubacteriales bacterium]
MLIHIARHDFTIIWDGVYQFALSDYPHLSRWELQKLAQFALYERAHGREPVLRCEEETLRAAAQAALDAPDRYLGAAPPARITECTACLDGGCLTELVCHTAAQDAARSIFTDGCIKSAARVRGLSPEALASEARNAAGDPPDYFEHLMLAWGNCQAGDRLIVERALGHSPDEEELLRCFAPGARFYFRYDTLARHPAAVFDGYHPLKIRDELALAPNLLCAVLPAAWQSQFSALISPAVAPRVLWLPRGGEDIWQWAQKSVRAALTFAAQSARIHHIPTTRTDQMETQKL